MPNRPPVPTSCGALHPNGSRCTLIANHAGAHAVSLMWDDLGDVATAETVRLPPITESLGPRRRPPAPLVRELRERTELLRALVDELAAYDDSDGQE